MRIGALATLAVAALLTAGCGAADQSSVGSGSARQASAAGPLGLQAHPQAIDPAAAQSPSTAAPGGSAQIGAGTSSGAVAQPVSDAAVRQELAASGINANAGQATLTPNGLAIAPFDAPPAVQQVIDAGNQIALLPYRFGGGHGTFVDNAYDCSGSISFAFAAAHLVNSTYTSGELINWGAPGRGKWITVFANNGHTFMYVAGLRFDTVALAQGGSRWSDRSATERDGFAVRHPPGL